MRCRNPAGRGVRQRRSRRLDRNNIYTVEQMARDAMAFLTAMDVGQIDLLGSPSAASSPRRSPWPGQPSSGGRNGLPSPAGAAGMHGWAPDVIGAVGTPETSPGEYLDVFFTRSASSRRLARRRCSACTPEPRPRPGHDLATREAQYDAVCRWGIPNHSLLQRLSALEMPVFVANGDSDPMILPHYSYLLAGLIPQARVKIYPDFRARVPVPASTPGSPLTSRRSSPTPVRRRHRLARRPPMSPPAGQRPYCKPQPDAPRRKP